MPFAEMELLVQPLVPLAEVQIEIDQDLATVTPVGEKVGQPIDSTGPLKYVVKLSNALTARRFELSGLVTGRTNDGEAFPPVALHIKGTVSQSVKAYPRDVRLGVRRIGDSGTLAIELSTASDEKFSVRSIATSSEYASVSPGETGTGNNHVFDLTWRCEIVGKHSENLLFHVESESGKQIIVDVPVSIYGVSPRGNKQEANQ
ncbi:MAG TPA: hypothetical protein VMM76_24170 [Pirellulaceae bacterium]|nr:hypothetical protein [Pirellulaceae bacterium]